MHPAVIFAIVFSCLVAIVASIWIIKYRHKKKLERLGAVDFMNPVVKNRDITLTFAPETPEKPENQQQQKRNLNISKPSPTNAGYKNTKPTTISTVKQSGNTNSNRNNGDRNFSINITVDSDGTGNASGKCDDIIPAKGGDISSAVSSGHAIKDSHHHNDSATYFTSPFTHSPSYKSHSGGRSYSHHYHSSSNNYLSSNDHSSSNNYSSSNGCSSSSNDCSGGGGGGGGGDGGGGSSSCF
ncbi:hypothetical protein BGX27_005188 [Mortierella sp. AM989]|nr:hypothetical protein BGX27_005188 [Mortierella sp. AM989]